MVEDTTRNFIQPDVHGSTVEKGGMGEYLKTLYASLGIDAFSPKSEGVTCRCMINMSLNE